MFFKSSNATVRVIILIFWLHKDLNSKRSWLIGMQTHFYVIHQVHLLCVCIDDEAFIFLSVFDFFYQSWNTFGRLQYVCISRYDLADRPLKRSKWQTCYVKTAVHMSRRSCSLIFLIFWNYFNENKKYEYIVWIHYG